MNREKMLKDELEPKATSPDYLEHKNREGTHKLHLVHEEKRDNMKKRGLERETGV